MLDVRTAQTELEDALRDAVLYALGRRIANVANVAALRAFPSRGHTGSSLHDDCLAVIVVANVVTASYRWSQGSSAADNGTTVIKPDDVVGNGRWLSWTSTMRFSPEVGGDSFYLHEIEQGPVECVIVLDKATEKKDINALITGQVPSVVIEATDDTPVDMTYMTGHRWDTDFGFTISVIAQNLRDRRQAAQGSSLDSAVGANGIDGAIVALLAGTTLNSVLDAVRNVRVGRGFNWFSTEGQRRVIRSRSYSVIATETNPAAPNDIGPAEQIDAQPELTELGETDPPFDMDNHVSSGITVPLGAGLTKFVAAGTAFIDGDEITYAGEFVTFSANVDAYRDLKDDGTLVVTEVAHGAPAPSLTAGALRVGVTETDSSGVLSDRYIAASRIPLGNPIEIPLV